MTQDYVNAHFKKALQTLGVEESTPISFEVPKIAEHGDLSTNIAMTLAKPMRKPPRAIAESILQNLELDAEFVSSVEIAGAGFINIKFTPKFYTDSLKTIAGVGEKFGLLKTGEGKRVNIEYVSANPTGPLHLGHGRNAALGDTVANLLEWNGYDVTREYYYNNAGNQMNLLAKSIYARYMQALGEDFPFPENGYHGENIKEIANFLKEQHGDALKAETPENHELFKKQGEEWYSRLQRETLKAMNIEHDVFFNEDTLYHDGRITATVEALRKKGFVYEADGATWLALEKMGLEKDRPIIKSSGEPTYRLPDIAYHVTKFERGFDLMIDVFGPDHIAAIPDVMAALKVLGWDSDKVKPIIYQLVTLFEDGEIVKMSKRSGKSYTLDQLIEELGADVVRFFFIMRGQNTPLDFDLNLARESSDKNPVFYLQYAHARICNIFFKAEERGISFKSETDFDVLKESAEQNLIKTLLRFPEVVLKAGRAYEPQVLVEYLREVATAFHAFYHDCPILKLEDQEILQARLKIADVARIVLKNGLTILGVSAPEKM